MPRKVKKVSVRVKKAKSKTTTIGSKNITQTVKINLGGRGGDKLDELYKKENKMMGGLGTASTPSYPSSPSYYRLAPPNQQFAHVPDALSGRNQAVPNNLVSQTLLRPSYGQVGHASVPVSAPPRPSEYRSSLPGFSYAGSSHRIVSSDPEPNRPISVVQSEMAAGRPILSDPSLPRQRPAGRDNYVTPYDAERGAPDSGYFPQQAQAPVSVVEQQELQREVAQMVIPKRVKRPVMAPKLDEGKEEEEEEEHSNVPMERAVGQHDVWVSNAREYANSNIYGMGKNELREVASRLGLTRRVGRAEKNVETLKIEITDRINSLLQRSSSASSSSSSSGAF